MAVAVLKKGSKNNYVKALQYILGIEADGIFGSGTLASVKEYQKTLGVTSDGIVGKNTVTKIVDILPILKKDSTGKYVQALESLLQTLTLDGNFEADEVNHVKTYQSANNLIADGIVGQQTWKRLWGLTSNINLDDNSTSQTNKQPKNYKQYDSKWKNVVFTKNNTYNKNQTIGSSGCGPTAVSDIVCTWWDSSVTPVDMAALAVSKGYRSENNGTSWGFFKFVASKYGASKFIQTSAYATAEAAIQNGAYVVCSMGPGIWTKKGHYICWWKVDDQYVYINDPASSASARAKSNKSNLKNQCKQYFIFYK